ncbi:MAG: hypothetical protein K9L79_14225 [Methylobacter tundripaludum]|nr:hypothetical protein [Methylobacter tundripaludum]
MSTEPDLKTKEDWLRQEIRASRTLATSLLQWGITVLAAVELNLYYVRRDVMKHLLDAGKLKVDELLPFPRWLIGTLLLSLLAYIFSQYMKRTVLHHVAYRTQLVSMAPSYSGIEETVSTGGSINKIHYYLYFAFPLFDIGVWLLFYAGERLNIQISIPW